jgi:hypothetical protein
MMKLAAFLETEGGKTAAIIFMLVFVAILLDIYTATGHVLQETGRTLFSSLVTGLTALLLTKLGSKSKSEEK